MLRKRVERVAGDVVVTTFRAVIVACLVVGTVRRFVLPRRRR